MISQHDRSSSCNWSLQLKRTRAVREKFLSSDNSKINLEDGKEFLNHFRSLKEDIRTQVRQCCSTSSSCVESTTADSTTASQNEYKQHRLALRVALCCLSIPPENQYNDELRRTIQQESYDCWHAALLTAIMNKDVDEPCRLLAAQVLCNTITDCPQTALQIMKDVPPAPTDIAIAQKIRDDVLLSHTTIDTGISESIRMSSNGTNWVDLLLASTTCRSLLAVVVACLHNSLCSITKCAPDATNTDNDCNPIDSIITKVARSTLLISTLLRRIVSALSIHSSQNVDPTTTTSTTTTATDEATEWILLLISKLCRLGFLTEMYQSIGGNKDDHCPVYPEHIVLLHSVRNMMEECKYSNIDVTGKNSIDADKKSRCYCLGGENRIENRQAMIDAHVFLAGLYIALSSALSDSRNGTADHDTLQASALQLVLDILAESLSEDSAISDRIRQLFGSTTTILQTIVFDLATILDHWHAVNKALSTRDQTKMNESDQCRITTSVRVIGNLCFHCRQNQDLLRSIKVPDTALDNLSTSSENSERNGLHVLLSTTSMSYVCFTLREWAVVAIRSVLEDCPENQAIVLELEGQTAMQTADLDEMGIRVSLNVPTGTVTVDQLLDK